MAKPPREMLSVLLRSGDGRVVPSNQQEEIGMEATVEAPSAQTRVDYMSRPGALSRFFRYEPRWVEEQVQRPQGHRQRLQEPHCRPDQEPRAVEDQSRESGRADHHPGSRDRRTDYRLLTTDHWLLTVGGHLQQRSELHHDVITPSQVSRRAAPSSTAWCLD